MLSIKSRLIRGQQWLLRFGAIPLLGSIPTLRSGSGSGERRLKVPPGVHLEAVDADGVRCEWLIPVDAPGDAVLLYFHGGGGVLGLTNSGRNMVGYIALACKLRALVVDYRLAPEYPYPHGLNDCVAAYRWLVARGFQPKHMVLGGDSMGGLLALSTLLMIRDARQVLPAAAVCLSPNTDIALTGRSIQTNAWRDALLSPQFLRTMVSHYAGGHDPCDPYLSPLAADLHGLPPILIQVGADELLLDDSVRFQDCAASAGVDVTLEVWPHVWHDWHSCVPGLPEAREAIEHIARFIGEHI